MTSNLLLGTFGIWEQTTAVTASLAMDSTSPAANLAGGGRWDMAKVATATTGDLLLTLALSSAASCNFLYLAHANLLKKGGVNTITLKGHSANSYAAATTVTTLSSFTSATLQGPASEDYVTTFSASAAYAWWFLNYNSPSNSTQYQHSKAFLGTYVDPGRDPAFNRPVRKVYANHAQKRPYHVFDFTWDGLTYAKAAELYTTLAATRFYRPVALFTNGYTGVLGGYQCMLCRVVDFSAPPTATGANQVTATFEELL